MSVNAVANFLLEIKHDIHYLHSDTTKELLELLYYEHFLLYLLLYPMWNLIGLSLSHLLPIESFRVEKTHDLMGGYRFYSHQYN